MKKYWIVLLITVLSLVIVCTFCACGDKKNETLDEPGRITDGQESGEETNKPGEQQEPTHTIEDHTHTYIDHACSVCGQEQPSTDGLVFTLQENNTYEVTEYQGTEIDVYIASAHDGKSVTSIGYGAFMGCTGLTSVTIGNGVTSIGDYAFYGCTGLTSVTIGNGVTSIGESAFSGCNNLLYNEYDNAYYLGNANNPYVVLIKARDTSVTSCLIHTDTRVIYESAFDRCTGLTSIAIPNSVTCIGEGTFSRCTGLTSITIPDRVTSIRRHAFSNCSRLTSVTIGNGVTSIGEYAFDGCTRLTSITIPDSVTSIGGRAFGDRNRNNLQYNEYDNAYYLGNAINPYVVLIHVRDTSITSCLIHTDTRVIHESAFYECSDLTSITIPNSVTSIGEDAFSSCSSLTSVYYTGDIASWCGITFGLGSSNPLYYAHNLYIDNELIKDIVIPDTVTEIGYQFTGWNGTSITLPDSVTSIRSSAFDGCRGLTSITIPDSVTSIGIDAFSECNNLLYNEYDNAYYLGNVNNPYVVLIKARDTSVTSCLIHTDTRVIYGSAFADCSGLTSIMIPDSVTSIGYEAFRGCTGLTSVTIGNGVTSIEEYAFSDCSQLRSIVFTGTIKQWRRAIRSAYWAQCIEDCVVVCKDGSVSVP